MPNHNPLKRAFSEGRKAFGLWATLPDPFAVELMAGGGFDYVCVDRQHGLIGYETLVSMLRAAENAGLAPLTRVTQNSPAEIMRSLDAGALGVIVPLVNTPEEAARAVAACRFPPRGERSYGPIRAAGVLGSGSPEHLAGEVLCLAMIETREGLANVEEIAATPGLDGIYVGPADLALSLGLEPASAGENPEHRKAVQRIRDACHRSGIAAGMHGSSGGEAREYAEQGFDFATAAVDAYLLADAAQREAAQARRRD
ncbi:2,4-dihydroxyhept-2-ene-1,7-dioic acid aldolase [Rubrobacter taiwanensis]|jgi:4-hydroxy-2-oxoheptanedioate aldolase|uniref:2,4-dihydroxyhept-2-ene-1,7-dioic acid aldolase n=1 Tax=Rubrobacter taiwanensis TaxID=185139 RepID=A0A4R1BN43_9ACTN|nr:aldolase/citrate lyase family protein [Rubrobacter taiwanensis]TCJ18889.1 2,4-dihydroxyhept-2-ene-1,7-dioic acid aldolase [Rubrobacter taiwanensis]